MEAVNISRVVVEVLDAHGRVQARQRFEVAGTSCRFTLGRSVRADVMLDDPHVAALHAAVEVTTEGRVLVSDLGSVNGIVAGTRRLRGVTDHVLDGRELELGRTVVRIRTDGEALLPERIDRELDLERSVPRVAALGLLAWLGWAAYSSWLEAPRDLPTTMASSLAIAVAIAAAWIASWSLLSRMLQGRWRWATHAAIFFGVSAIAYGADLLLSVAWFAFDLPGLEVGEAVAMVTGMAILLYLHLINVSALRRRTAVFFAGVLPLVVVGTASWIQARNHARDVNYIGVTLNVYPPALRLHSGATVDEYFADAAKLKAAADRKRKAMPASDAEEGDAASE